MAEQPTRKQQNQAFLQELEKQRLNKPCLRIIDLRGKVAGECQAYEFGDRVHYLDDRAYLLVKQLMARFDGRYTIGVYEALFKALKQLSAPVDAAPPSEQARFLSLDQSVQRSDNRLTLSTPVKLRLNDMLYHGHTVDLSATAIRVACKRTFSLETGDRVTVEFSDLAEQHNNELLQQAPYRIIKLEHHDSHTRLVLRQEAEHNALTHWLAQWLEQQTSARQQNVDDELLNLQTEFYQRLWLSNLSAPLLWLGSESATSPLLRLHLTPAAEALLTTTGLSEQDWFAKLPLQQLHQQHGFMLCVFNQRDSFSVPVENAESVQAVINWHLANAASQLLLLQATPVTLSQQQLDDCLLTLSNEGHETDATAELKYLSRLVTVCDLSPCFRHTLPTNTVETENLQPWQTAESDKWQIPEPTSLRPCIQRDQARFYIHTPVTVQVQETQWQLETVDVSADGLSIRSPETVAISVNQRLHVGFSRWQTLTSKVKLDAIPYQIKNIRHWQGQHQLGLERIKHNCPDSLNRFFDQVIEQNQQSLRHNYQDQLTAAESQLLSSPALANLDTVPVFLGVDDEGQRRIIFVGNTESNQADKSEDYWLSLESLTRRWQTLLKPSSNDQRQSFSTCVYSYKNGQQWMHALEQDFSQPREKTLFIQRALSADAFKVMQTTLTAFTGQEAELEHDLLSRLQQWRSQRPHRTQALRQQLSQLVSMLEMKDISSMIQLHYQHQP